MKFNYYFLMRDLILSIIKSTEILLLGIKVISVNKKNFKNMLNVNLFL